MVYFDRDHDILGTIIRLPARHMLDWIRLHHPRYDMPLADVSDNVARKYPAACMIDIGANIGDTAAFMLQGSRDIALLCIEGNPEFTPYLRRNTKFASGNVEIVEAYVGEADGTVDGCITSSNGTAKLTQGNGTVPTKSLATILKDYPKFGASKLLKIDTDGQDAKIIMGAIDLLRDMKPAIFLEYYPLGGLETAKECRSMIEALVGAGYSSLHVFDNFGNHMVRVRGDKIEQIQSLTAYVRAQQRTTRPTVNYYDICAFHAEDEDLSNKLLRRYDWDG